ncbi:hypothetical protein BpOF4_16985 [Alkalihalophilus pseudofirmus OF4]|uniref:Uncharacterized protein n=1 Tax=Alkalihalophilus pseudofirmus (strain ATCC BAA-2126 / JCM 17055 / OF4) TaxID=398511 RepID=D3FQS0_ALKPO|nr:hypothetical protein BpOF4_16985 [Alkalihalophilus pseudofirmus OF4]
MLTEFDGSVTPAPITITEPPADPVTLGTVRLFIDDLTDRVLLQATIPWRIDLEDETGLFGPIFRILRNGDPIFEAIDTLQITDGFCFNRITSITFLDENPPLGVVTYTLTALRFCSEGGPFTVSTSAATTFTASEIEGNTP